MEVAVAPAASQEPSSSSESWESWIHRQGPVLAEKIRHRLRRAHQIVDPELVGELLQDAYCRLVERSRVDALPAWRREPRKLSAYLTRVAESVVLDYLRRRQAVKRGTSRGVQLTSDQESILRERCIDPRPTPEERVLADDGFSRIVTRVRAIEAGEKGAQRLRVLLWAAVGGLTSREIAERLPGAVTPSSVDSLLYRLRQRLRVGLREPWSEGGKRSEQAQAG